MQGGMGGRGNDHFKSSVNQSPRYSQPGIEGQQGWKILELKVLADVGLVGFPNVGKSTLLSVVSAAKPEIADYEFTTLTPNLGIVPYRNDRSFVMADIPGIIENAHLGKGLGVRFLRHIERNSVLLFIIPADSKDIHAEYRILLNELKMYNPELLDKERLLAITKSDLADDELQEALAIDLPRRFGWKGLGYFVLATALTITLCDQLSSNLFKPFFARYRPCNNLDIIDIVHTVRGRCGSGFSFISGHATNFFGVATLLSFTLANRQYTVILMLWAGLIAYSRVYLGVHYPADVTLGALFGILIGYLTYRVFTFFMRPKATT
ncbi:UNVERIFIED_CONTAM: hypothetical protein GTU68_032934 [Idotea baltica]|nr:hypothetical protein [Idotea baltica]